MSVARPPAVLIVDVCAGFMEFFGRVRGALRGWCGVGAQVLSVRGVRAQLERTRSALMGSGFQVARTAHHRYRPRYRTCAFANSIPWTLESRGMHAVSLALAAAVSLFDMSAGFMRFFRNLCAAQRRWCRTVALASRVRNVTSQPGRPQTALTPSRSQATSPANPRHRPTHRAPAPAHSIPRTLAPYGTHAVSLARPAAVLVFDVSARFMRFFRNVRGAARRWCGAVASASSVRKVQFERDRGRGARATAGFQAHTGDSTWSAGDGAGGRPGPDTPTHARSRARRAVRRTHPQDRPHPNPHLCAAAAHIAGGPHGQFPMPSSRVVR